MKTKNRRGRCLHRPATRIVSLILSLAMLFSITVGIDLSVFANSDDWQYTKLQNGTVEIVGYKGTDLSVEIPSEINEGEQVFAVTSVGDGAFSGCSSIVEIKIPDTVIIFGNMAFADCSELTKITFPNKIISLGEKAFYGCKKLVEIIMPDSIESIGNWAFADCSSLKEISIPDGVTNIGDYTFSNCSNLMKITLPNSVISMGDWAFYKCSSLTEIVIPNSVIDIGKGTFCDCSNLIEIEMPDSISDINCAAFWNCLKLEKITIPNSVISIGYGAFSNCKNLTSITIPNKVISIKQSTFMDCTSLNNVIISDGVESIDSYAFNRCKSIHNITIPNSVKKIDFQAFNDCSELYKIYIINPQCEINDNLDTISYTATIYGYKNSTAEAYAKKYNRTFVALDALELSSISIVSQPSKKTYYIGDSLNTSGLQLELTYSDGSTETVSSGYTVSGFSSTTAGTKTVTVNYEGLTTSFNVTVNTPSISLSQTSKTMTVGDRATLTATTTPSGQSVSWTSSNSSVASVSNGAVTAKASGTATITAKFTYNGKSYSKTCNITVNNVAKTLTSISIISNPTKTTYEIGESLNTSGLKLKLNYSDGSSEIVSNGFTTSGFDSSTAGAKTVTVTYQDKTTAFNITVNKAASQISAKYKISSVTATAGSTIDVYVSIENNPGIISLRNKIIYDTSVMELVNVEDLKLLSGYTTPSPTIDSPYTLRWADSLATQNNTASGNIVKLTFKIKDDAMEGEYSISVSHIEARTVNGEKVEFSQSDSVINVINYLPGDVDNDGEVNDWDAIVLNRYLAGWNTEINKFAADVDKDGEITDWDAIVLERYLADWDIELN